MFTRLTNPSTKHGLCRGEGAAAVGSQRAGRDAEGAGSCQGANESHQNEPQQAAAHHWGPPGPAVQRLRPQGQESSSYPSLLYTMKHEAGIC